MLLMVCHRYSAMDNCLAKVVVKKLTLNIELSIFLTMVLFTKGSG